MCFRVLNILNKEINRAMISQSEGDNRQTPIFGICDNYMILTTKTWYDVTICFHDVVLV